MPTLPQAILPPDVVGSRPAAGSNGRLFFATDEGKLYRDSGTAWVDVTPTATGGGAAPASHDHTGTGDGGVLTNPRFDGYLEVAQIGADPASPGASANLLRIYAKDKAGTTTLYYITEGGTIYELPTIVTGGGGAGSGAPSDATYIVASANTTLTAETLLSAVIAKGTEAARPAFGIPGRLYYSTDATNGHRLYRDTGAAWETLPLQWTDMVAEKPTLDQITAPAADVSLNSHKITSLTDPTSAQDAATKAYVDGLVNGVSWHRSVRAATTANGTLATAYANGQTIDGVTLSTGDRILLKNQTTASENGIYTVNASGAPTRATDADASAELVDAAVFVQEGTTLADTAWLCTTNAPITVGTTALTWTQFGAGGGSSLTIAEIDGSPSGTPTTLKFPNGTLTDNGDGSYTYTPAGGGTTPGLVKISETIVAGGAVASITLSSIPGTYRDLEIRITGRGSNTSTDVGVNIRFNGDSGANYGLEQTFDVNTTRGAAGSSGVTSAGLGSITAATAPANTPGVIRVTVFDYARTAWYKAGHSTSYTERAAAASSEVREDFGFVWRSTAAITSITLLPSAGNFNNDTVVSLYGVGG